jgi:hypothetical protein
MIWITNEQSYDSWQRQEIFLLSVKAELALSSLLYNTYWGPLPRGKMARA